MKAVTAHGVFLALMMLFAFQTWTRDDSRSDADRERGATIWELPADDMQSVTYQRESRRTVIERRDDDGEKTYLWGTQVTPRADSTQPPTVEEFPVGDGGEDLWESITTFRSLRDLGVLDDAKKEEYELLDPDRRIIVSLGDQSRTLEIGGTVYGSSQRYAWDPVSGEGYVLPEDLVRRLEAGMGSIRLRTLHRYAADDVASVVVRGSAGERAMTRQAESPDGDVWVDPASPEEPDQAFQNFMGHVESLAFSEFEKDVALDTLQFLVRIDFSGEAADSLGFLEVYRVAASTPDTWDYYLRTEATRIPALAHRSLAERVDRGLADLF